MPKQPAEPPLTAFPQTEAALRSKLTSAPLHGDSLRRPLQHCNLKHCQGMCCYDGIYLSAEEAAVVTYLAQTKADFFRDIGLDLPRRVVIEGSWENLVSGPKTAVAPRPFSRQVEGFPAHFNDTACVFLLQDGRCGLQVLSEVCGQHPWYYKPTGCWLHPLTTDYSDRPGLGMYDEAMDPCCLPHYDGFCARTFCGRTADAGQPAYKVLRGEIDFLGRIVHQNLFAELVRQVEQPPAHRLPLQVLPGEDRRGN
jgi:hypothetical protein